MVESAIPTLPDYVDELHTKYLISLDKTTDAEAIGHFTNEHLKLPGAYWCLSALNLQRKLDDARKEEIVKFIKACQHECGGFGGNVGHDPHIQNTLYALLILS